MASSRNHHTKKNKTKCFRRPIILEEDMIKKPDCDAISVLKMNRRKLEITHLETLVKRLMPIDIELSNTFLKSKDKPIIFTLFSEVFGIFYWSKILLFSQRNHQDKISDSNRLWIMLGAMIWCFVWF